MKSNYLKFGIGILMILLCACEGGSSESDGDPEGPTPGTKPFLSILPTTKTVGTAAGEFNVSVSSNTSWTVEPLAEWISIPVREGEKSSSVKIRYESSTVTSRSGEVMFSAEGVEPVKLRVTQGDKTFTNPLGGVPDPWIIQHDGWYYLCKAHGNGINLSRSKKLTELTSTQQVFAAPRDTEGNKPWNVANYWAPELHYIDGRWYIYYTAGRPISEFGGHYYSQRSGVLRAKSSDPFGEWEDMGMLYTGDHYTEGIVPTLENTEYFAIDLNVMEINGTLYAVWSGNPVGSTTQSLFIAEMKDPCTIGSNRVKLSDPDQPWELLTSTIQEGPAMIKHGNKAFIVYSCNGSWTKQYRLAYLELDDIRKDPMKPENWKKSASYVFFRNDDIRAKDNTYQEGINGEPGGVHGVGHCSFTKSPDGTEDWIVYHTKRFREDGYETYRYTFVQRFGWNADDTPNFGSPVGWEEPVVVPSGEE